MGVHDLWSILEPVRKSVPLYSLSGKTLAVDLSLWVCEALNVQAMMGRVTKPHLRNLFFRVSSLTLMGVKLVFVMEGEAPKIKAETMSKRTQGRLGGFQKSAAPKSTTNTSRGRFNAVLRECAEMLDYMGVPWVTAAGEAEAMCAYLDSQGLVDGCITNDGDAFLYGARTVYRNFNMNSKDPQVDCYQTSEVQRELHLSRENLVGLAIFLGCDYIPKGIPGVGKEQALRLLHTLKGQTLLQRFSQWKEHNTFISEAVVKKVPHCNVCRHPGSAKTHERGGCLLCDSKRFCQPQDFDYQCPCDWHRSEQCRQALSFEASIRKKTLASPLFPFTEIINEFLIAKDKPVSHFKRRQSNMLLMQKFAYDKMEWPKHYTSEKVLVLMTYTNLMNKKYGRDVSRQITPLRILKPRVRNGVSCLEVIWTTPEHYVFPEDQEPDNQHEVRTIEEEFLFRVAYPGVVESYMREKALTEENKTKKKKPKCKKEKTTDESDGISDLLAEMTLQNSSNADAQKLPCTISKVVEHEVIVLDSPVSHERREKDDHAGLDDCPGTLVSPASLSDSAVISALHLSDIDWDCASFTSSPLPPVPTRITVQLIQNTHTDVREAEEKCNKLTNEFKPADSRSVSEHCSSERPLRERVIMKNTNKAMMQINRNYNVEKQGSHEIPSTERISPQTSSPDDQISHKYNAESELSGKTNINKMKKTVTAENQCLTNKAKPETYNSKQPLKPTVLVPVSIKPKDTCSAFPKPPQKYKFVRTATSLSLVPSQRSHSDPGQSDKDRNITKAPKKSVCMSVCSSSGDSDSENQQVGPQRKSKTKAKPSYLSDLPLKPAHKVVKPKTNVADKVLPKLGNNSLKVGKGSIPSPKETQSQDGSSFNTDKGFLHCPASPATVLESDDSVICSDSPLPLAERLRLKFQEQAAFVPKHTVSHYF